MSLYPLSDAYICLGADSQSPSCVIFSYSQGAYPQKGSACCLSGIGVETPRRLTPHSLPYLCSPELCFFGLLGWWGRGSKAF